MNQQLKAYVERHGNCFTLGKHQYTIIRVDDTLPSRAALVSRGAEQMLAFPIRVQGNPTAEGWEVQRPSGKRMRRVAAFYVDAGQIRELP